MEHSRDITGENTEEMKSSNTVNEISNRELNDTKFYVVQLFFSAHIDCKQRLGGSDGMHDSV